MSRETGNNDGQDIKTSVPIIQLTGLVINPPTETENTTETNPEEDC